MIDTSSQKIQLFICARNLKDTDVFSKSDPYVKISFKRDFNVKQYMLLGRTETINNNLNPTFSKSFVIDYIFQSRQDIKFQVFDDDGGNDDFLGSAQTSIGAIMGSKNQTLILQLKIQNKNVGKLIVRGDKIQQSNEYLKMKFKAVKLMNTDSWFDFWDKSDPYLKFLKIRQDNTFVQVARTSTIMNNLNPSWQPIDIQGSRLHSKQSSKFKVQCWDWQQSGKDQFIGQIYLDMMDLAKQKFPLQILLQNPKVKKPGVLVLEKFQRFIRPSFVDYLRGGLQLNMIIAIDFTGSNGTPTSPSSLHYMNQYKPNQYQMAIKAVSDILLNYDSDKRIPSYGFGAKTPFQGYLGGVSHCFPLSGDPSNSQAMGFEHLMQMYSQTLKHVQLSGPTYFGPILKQSMNLANLCKNQGSTCYQTLLILTDGQIHDMDQSIDLIIRAAELPLSIIIVGVGSADFSNMIRLDGDNGLYSSNGKKCQRDIVQFVPFRDVQMNPDLLAKQLLAELPNQVVQYMLNVIGKPPGIPPQLNTFDNMLAQQSNKINEQQITSMMGNMKIKEQVNSSSSNPYGNI